MSSSENTTGWNILQIMPANGWGAVYDVSAPGENEELYMIPLVAWAMAEDLNESNARFVTGIEVGEESSSYFCEGIEGFKYYTLIDKWEKEQQAN